MKLGTGNWKRDGLIFLAGAEAFHTLTHVWIGMSGMLPMTVAGLPSFTLTPGLNLLAVAVNGLIMAGLLYWAYRLKG